ncbi:MAG TPA: ATP synthase F1 subunit delta [Ktedonobacterales bacterium]
MLKGAVARRFAEAVMDIALQQGAVDRWLADVRLIGEAFGNRQLAFVLREPNIPAQRKELIVRDLLANKVRPDALNLALVLVQDNLVEAGPRLAQEFERLYDEYRGQAKAQVITAMPLDGQEREQIANRLRELTGKRIILEERVDPAILGGVVARVGDTLIDGSVKRRLAVLRDQIIKGGGAFGGPLDGGASPDGGPQGGPGDQGPTGGAAGPAGSGPFVVAPKGTPNGGSPTSSGPTASAAEAGGASVTAMHAGASHGAFQPGGRRFNRRNGGRNRDRRR